MSGSSQPLQVIGISQATQTLEQLRTLVSATAMVAWAGESNSLVVDDIPAGDLVLLDTSQDVDTALKLIEAITTQAVPSGQLAPVVVALHDKMDADIILAAIRHGADEFIHIPNDLTSLKRILDQASERKQQMLIQASASQPAGNDNGKVVGIFSAKGGGGSTLLAINLAQQLARLNGKKTTGKVCVVDMHPQYNTVGHQLNMQFKHALSDVSSSHADGVDDKLLNKMLVSIPSKSSQPVDVLVCCKNPTDDNPSPDQHVWDSVLEALKHRYDWVILDQPSQVVDGIHQWVNSVADIGLIVSMMDLPSLSRTRQYMELAEKYLDTSKLHLVLNRYNLEAATNISYQKLEDAFQWEVFARLTNDWQVTVEASTLGQFLADVKPNSPLVKDINGLAAKLSGQGHEPHQAKGGFFGKLKKLLPMEGGQ